MKRIETKRPSVLGLPGRHFNPRKKTSVNNNFTPQVDAEILSKAEIRGAKDGFSYLRDIVLVLFSLYGSGRLSPRLGRSLPNMISTWLRREKPAERTLVKRNFKLRSELYDRALRRWQKDAPKDERTATAMFSFLLDSYGDGALEIALRMGGTE